MYIKSQKERKSSATQTCSLILGIVIAQNLFCSEVLRHAPQTNYLSPRDSEWVVTSIRFLDRKEFFYASSRLLPMLLSSNKFALKHISVNLKYRVFEKCVKLQFQAYFDFLKMPDSNESKSVSKDFLILTKITIEHLKCFNTLYF